jgi:hypothetical protein
LCSKDDKGEMGFEVRHTPNRFIRIFIWQAIVRRPSVSTEGLFYFVPAVPPPPGHSASPSPASPSSLRFQPPQAASASSLPLRRLPHHPAAFFKAHSSPSLSFRPFPSFRFSSFPLLFSGYFSLFLQPIYKPHRPTRPQHANKAR